MVVVDVYMMFPLLIMMFVVVANGITLDQARYLVSHNHSTGIYLFGDSTVDTGNNNVILPTPIKSDFPPYGVNYYDGKPTGRFCDGRLATDILADSFGFSKVIPAYYDCSPASEQLKYEANTVSFAFAGSGLNSFTDFEVQVPHLSTQLHNFENYKQTLAAIKGNESADEIIKKAICMISTCANDFVENYFNPLSPQHLALTLDEFEDTLVASMHHTIIGLRKIGCRRVVVYGCSCLGCLPIVKSLSGNTTGPCVEKFNQAAISTNSKLIKDFAKLERSYNVKIAFVDIFDPFSDMIYNPHKYGFKESSRGCCGKGTVEFALLCKNKPICSNPREYVFFDAVHPSEEAYKVLAATSLASFEYEFFL
ncbi:hypothetical protein Drorol1_Dr00015479 [Drosera rotundifolia]